MARRPAGHLDERVWLVLSVGSLVLCRAFGVLKLETVNEVEMTEVEVTFPVVLMLESCQPLHPGHFLLLSAVNAECLALSYNLVLGTQPQFNT